MCYTDDPHGMCVGIDRLVRMLRCWRGLTLAINARMARFVKYTPERVSSVTKM